MLLNGVLIVPDLSNDKIVSENVLLHDINLIFVVNNEARHYWSVRYDDSIAMHFKQEFTMGCMIIQNNDIQYWKSRRRLLGKNNAQ